MKLLLQLIILCLFASSNLMAQQAQEITTNSIETAVNTVPNTLYYDVVLTSRNNAPTRKQPVVETTLLTNRKNKKKTTHREVIAKRKCVASMY